MQTDFDAEGVLDDTPGHKERKSLWERFRSLPLVREWLGLDLSAEEREEVTRDMREW